MMEQKKMDDIIAAKSVAVKDVTIRKQINMKSDHSMVTSRVKIKTERTKMLLKMNTCLNTITEIGIAN